jgi:Family of unknown function (DUF5686)/CarboxypepD_reg-like domain
MRTFFFLLTFFFFPLLGFAARISGLVTDNLNAPVPFAIVYVKGTSIGTIANDDGFYFLEVKDGTYQLEFKLIGYQLLQKEVTIATQNIELNVQLNPVAISLKEYKVNVANEDPANAIIREAQKKRNYYLNQVKAYSCNVFIKGVARITQYPPKKVAGLKVSIGGLIDSASGIVYLSESESKYYFQQPDNVHEVMLASKTSGQKSGLSYNRASELDFNFYKTTLRNTALSERGFISPIAPSAFRFYKYKLLGAFYEKEELINKIQVIPKRKTDAVFSGVIYISENSWRIHSVDLVLDKNSGIEWVDSLRIQEEFLKVNDSIWMPFKNSFEYVYAAFGARAKGNFVGINSDYLIIREFPKSTFKPELISFSDDALNKDSLFWQTKRIIPLSKVEIKDYHKRDSIEVVHSSFKYIDSTEKAKNKFKWSDIVDGFTYKSSLRKMEFNLEPMFKSVSYNTVQGLVIDPTVRLNKEISETKNYELGGTAGYGFSNEVYYGFGHATYTYNRKTFSKITMSGGKDMLQFNSNAISPMVNTLYTLLLKDNFMKIFEKYYSRVEHSSELVNGLVFYAAAEFADRNPLRNTTDFSLFNSSKEFISNDPQIPDNQQFAFARNQSFHLEGALELTPFQKYYFYKGDKMIQDSRFPTFTFFYKRAIKGVLESDVDLDLIKIGAEGDIRWSRIGSLHYILEAGKFMNRTAMNFMDWRYFNGNKTLYSNFSGKQYQLLDYYTNSTNNQYAEMHLQQNLNGAIMNKIPLLKRAKIQEMITANLLLTSDNVQYAEIGVGLQKLFIRVDYIFGFNKGEYSDSSLRFGFLF